MYDKIRLAVRHQFQSISQKIECDKSNVLLTHRTDFWGNGNREISQYALRKAFQVYEKAKKLPNDDSLQRDCLLSSSDVLCSNTFSPTMGMPCSHVMREIIRRKLALKPEDFHTHSPFENSQQNSARTFAETLSELAATYESLPPHRQRVFQESVDVLINIRRDPNLIQNPDQITGRGRPQGSTAYNQLRCPRPSQIEIQFSIILRGWFK